MLAQQTISVDVAGLLKVFMEHHDIDSPDIVQALYMTEGNGITYQQWWDVLASLRDVSGIDHLGLVLGDCIAPEFSGVLGYLSLSSLTLGEAVTYFERFQHLLYGGTGAKIERHEDTIRCQWQPAYCDTNKESDETLIAALVSYARLLTGNKTLGPSRVGFMHKKPTDITAYETFFYCDILFDCPALFIEVPLNLGNLLSKNSNPALGEILKQQAEAMLSTLPASSTDLLDRVKLSIDESLSSGKPTQEHVATSIGISSRTLHRKLAEKNIRFSSLIKEIRYQMARQYLDEGKLSISSIAHRLGYAEQSAFTRAFKNWSGITPISYARRNRFKRGGVAAAN